MLWWVLIVFGLTVLVLQWMIFRRQFVFILIGLLLSVGGGLGAAGIYGIRAEKPLEDAAKALQKTVAPMLDAQPTASSSSTSTINQAPVLEAPANSVTPATLNPADVTSLVVVPETFTLEVLSNTTATIKLERANGQLLTTNSAPAKFDKLEAGVYTVRVETLGSKGFVGSVNVPQTKLLNVFLER